VIYLQTALGECIGYFALIDTRMFKMPSIPERLQITISQSRFVSGEQR